MQGKIVFPRSITLVKQRVEEFLNLRKLSFSFHEAIRL